MSEAKGACTKPKKNITPQPERGRTWLQGKTKGFGVTYQIRLSASSYLDLTLIHHNKRSTWLYIIPTKDNFIALSPDEFRDAIAPRCHFPPKGLPSMCDVWMY